MGWDHEAKRSEGRGQGLLVLRSPRKAPDNMHELDPARSRRSDKPRLFATLDMAIVQAGVVDIDSDALYALSSWSLDQGRRFPWYFKREKDILQAEGGRDAAILTLAGIVLAKLAEGNDNAPYEAGVEWRNELRRQWGDLSPSQRAHWQQPVVFGAIETGDRPVEDWIDEHAVELAGPTPGDFDTNDIRDPRLKELWDRLTPAQREVVVLKAEGLTTEQVGEHLGISYSAANLRFAAAKAKATGAAA